jgi:hypothetical protein
MLEKEEEAISFKPLKFQVLEYIGIHTLKKLLLYLLGESCYKYLYTKMPVSIHLLPVYETLSQDYCILCILINLLP